MARAQRIRTADVSGSQGKELSPSELKVLRYLPTNLTRPEIASELSLSVNTVSTHVRNIPAKLGASDRSSAVQRARGAVLGWPFEARFVTTVSFGGESVPHGRWWVERTDSPDSC